LADTWQQAGSARVSAEYETNPAMSTTHPDKIWRALVEPSYTLTDTFGANVLNAGLGLQIARSSNKTLSQDREDPNAFLDWRRQSDVSEYGISAKYDEIATRNAPIDNAVPGYTDSTRASRTISGNWSRTLSERVTLSLTGVHSYVFYKGGTYINYFTRSGEMTFSYALSERSSTFLRTSYQNYEPAGSNLHSQFASVQIGWNWKVSDYLEGTLQAGRSKISGPMYGKQGSVILRYTGPRSRLALNAGREVTPSGLGSFVTVDQVSGNWDYDLSDLSKTGIDLGWYKSHFGPGSISRITGAWLQHDLNSSWAARASYQLRINEWGGVGRASSNILAFSLVYTRPDF
jgi:hypothetical protein